MHCFKSPKTTDTKHTKIFRCCHLGRSTQNSACITHTYHTFFSPTFQFTPDRACKETTSSIFLLSFRDYPVKSRRMLMTPQTNTMSGPQHPVLDIHNLLSTVSSQTTLHSRLILHFYTVTLGKPVLYLLAYCALSVFSDTLSAG